MLVENNPYPQDTRVRSEAEALTGGGYQVSVIAPAGPRQPWHERVCGVDVWRYPMPWGIPGAIGYVWEYTYSLAAAVVLTLAVLATRGIDVVHAHNPPDVYFIIGGLVRLFGKRFVFDHHDLAPEMYLAKFGPGARAWVASVLVWCERLSCRLANHVIATNESYRRVEMQRSGIAPERITVVRNGPDVQRIRPVDPDPALRGRAGFLIGYVGEIGAQDGVDYLLRALSHLTRDLGRSDWYCVIIGDGDALDDLREVLRQLHLEERVWLTGRLESAEVIRLLSSVDVCVVPDPSNAYNDRSTMIKLMEYMALGQPTVAFNLPEHRVTAGPAALYVTPNDEREFAQALLTLIDNPALRREMGLAGRRRAEDILAWPHSARRLLEVYARLGGAAPSPLPVQ